MAEDEQREISLELRRWAMNRERRSLDSSLCHRAADYIEQLEAEVDRLVETHAEELLAIRAEAERA